MANEPDNKALSIKPRSYSNSAGKNVLEYVTANTIVLNTEFIMISPN